MPDLEILLVEDNPDDAALAVRALKKSNMNNILVLSDGEAALDYLLCTGPYSQRDILERPRVVFLDLKLPKRSGFEVLQAIKKEPRLRDIPVVIVTSSHEEPDLQKCWALGANSYVVKPIQFDDFTRLIKELGLYWLSVNKVPWTHPVNGS